ncbi:hypothetical protein VDBG_02774 [Verticillium alfalfae VaMs.102]|uniref:RING-type domain-containing protein n=1 Tax=Verticillium alfalfae (strain VaMs.102 / ATCC MYA-4576 / FGSC 10136) TaxID=526221 RepID=C9SES2_VERA1|nr:hypothetical protein VDBG_02774 [Verticillium alfalfae VaMs.102]EEY16665.1 hypothetical protein VDBG_02774 [Verticillium alfalfae VaMs.102]
MLIAGDGRPKYPRPPSRVPEDDLAFACGEGPGSESSKDSVQLALQERQARGLQPLEPCMVMFCGHMFCEPCALLLGENTVGGTAECPLCKKDLRRPLCDRDEHPHLAMIPFPATSAALRGFPRTLTEGGRLPPVCVWCFANLLTDGLLRRYQTAPGDAARCPIEAVMYWAGPGESSVVSTPLDPELGKWQSELDGLQLEFLDFAGADWAGDRVYLPGFKMLLRVAMKRRGAISE